MRATASRKEKVSQSGLGGQVQSSTRGSRRAHVGHTLSMIKAETSGVEATPGGEGYDGGDFRPPWAPEAGPGRTGHWSAA
jgi:hypothetical protein